MRTESIQMVKVCISPILAVFLEFFDTLNTRRHENSSILFIRIYCIKLQEKIQKNIWNISQEYGQSYCLVDGTFDFLEAGLILFTIMIPIKQRGIPVIWGITNRKTESAYTGMFKAIKDLFGDSWEPSHILTDFEVINFDENLLKFN